MPEIRSGRIGKWCAFPEAVESTDHDCDKKNWTMSRSRACCSLRHTGWRLRCSAARGIVSRSIETHARRSQFDDGSRPICDWLARQAAERLHAPTADCLRLPLYRVPIEQFGDAAGPFAIPVAGSACLEKVDTLQ